MMKIESVALNRKIVVGLRCLSYQYPRIRQELTRHLARIEVDEFAIEETQEPGRKSRTSALRIELGVEVRLGIRSDFRSRAEHWIGGLCLCPH